MDNTEYDTWLKDQTPEALAATVKTFDPVINSEIQRFQGPKPLLRSKARSLTIRAIKSYDPKSGAQLRSWVTTQLQPLARYGQQLRPVHAPEIAIRQAAEVNRVSRDLSDELGHDPTDDELADVIGISPKRVRAVRKLVRPTVSEGAMADAAEDDGTGVGGGLPGVTQGSQLGTIEEAVYDELDDRDKKIFDWKVGRHGEKPLPNHIIAARLGVTPALISQRTSVIGMRIADLQRRGIL